MGGEGGVDGVDGTWGSEAREEGRWWVDELGGGVG